MKESRYRFVAVGFAGLMMLGLMPPGCGGGLGQVTVRQDSSDDRPAVPETTVERLQECVADYGKQLEPGQYRFTPRVRVDQGGVSRGVSTDDIPSTTPDLAACTRVVLRDMAIPASILNSAPKDAVATTDRSYMGSPAAAVVVIVVLGELALEAGAYTILFAITVEVVSEAAKDIAEAVRRRRSKKDECTDGYEECRDSSVGDGRGNNWNMTRCGTCLEWCNRNKSWPSQVPMPEGWVPCGRLGSTWKN